MGWYSTHFSRATKWFSRQLRSVAQRPLRNLKSSDQAGDFCLGGRLSMALRTAKGEGSFAVADRNGCFLRHALEIFMTSHGGLPSG
jgi:hypothetical protein